MSYTTKTLTHSLGLVFAVAAFAVGQVQAGDGKRPKFDLNGDGVVTTDEVVQRRTSMFAKSDLDGDGYVTQQEIEQFKAQMREQRAAASKRKYFARIDTDGDGKISAEESRTHAEGMAGKLDSNDDGEISRDEFRAVMKAMHKQHKGGDGPR